MRLSHHLTRLLHCLPFLSLNLNLSMYLIFLLLLLFPRLFQKVTKKRFLLHHLLLSLVPLRLTHQALW